MRFGSALVVVGSVLLTACFGSGGSDGFEELDEVPAECSQYAIADNVTIANEILGESSRELTLDRAERDALAKRVEGVLDLVHERFPSTMLLRVPPTDRWQVYLEPGAELRQRVLEQATMNTDEIVVDKTGDRELDSLGEALGLHAMRFKWHTPSDSLYGMVCLSDNANTPVAAERYSDIDSIDDAYAVPLIAGNSLIDMREVNGTWFVASDDAGFDPFSGCSGDGPLFLRVEDGTVEEVPEDEAMREEAFVRVFTLVECRQNDRWPYITPAP